MSAPTATPGPEAGAGTVLETPRLRLRLFTPDDAPFMLGLLNEPSYIANVADRGVRTVEAAREFMQTRMLKSYAENGYGLYGVELRGQPGLIGMCGLINRTAIGEIDVGYAFLPPYWGQGYAAEAAAASLAYGRDRFGMTRIVAIVSPDNARSKRVLEKIGLRYEKKVRLPGEETDIDLFS